jgi:hypothetical protein
MQSVFNMLTIRPRIMTTRTMRSTSVVKGRQMIAIFASGPKDQWMEP